MTNIQNPANLQGIKFLSGTFFTHVIDYSLVLKVNNRIRAE
jgi:hypothetical protein